MRSNCRKLLICGSFMPFHIGHVDIISKTLNLFDRGIVIGKGTNLEKSKHKLDTEIDVIGRFFSEEPRIVQVLSYSESTVEFCQRQGIDLIVRGIRDEKDYSYEKNLARINLEMGNIQTVFIQATPGSEWISSSMCRAFYDKGNWEAIKDFLVTSESNKFKE